MTIGEALLYEQKKLGFTSEKMSRGILSKSEYSRVINGERNISGDFLIQILYKNNIDINNFFTKLEDTYMPRADRIEKKLAYDMAWAVNNHNKDKAEECYKKIMSMHVSSFLKKRAQSAISFLNNNADKLDKNFKEAVLTDLNNNDNWVTNVDALKLFSTAITILSADNVETEISFFFKKINRLSYISDPMQERYATICSNYLHWKYNQLIKSHMLKNTKNVEHAIKYMKNLKSSSHTIIYIISAQYYTALFEDDIERAKKIKEELIDMGCTLVVHNWPI